VHGPAGVKSGERTCQTGGVGKEVRKINRLACRYPVGHRGAPGPLRHGVGTALYLADCENASEMRVGHSRRAADRGHILLASLGGGLRAETPDQDRSVQRSVRCEPLLDISVSAKPDLQRVSIRYRGGHGFQFSSYDAR
jgi:hypothetical protein